MPIDPSISLQIRPVQVDNPLEAYGRVLALKGMMQQQKMGDLQYQQAQQEMDDQRKMRQAYMDSGGDLTKLKQRAAELGVGPKTIMALDQSLLAQREKLSTISKNELQVKKDHTEAIGSAAQAVLQLPPEMRQQGYAQARANLITQGRIRPEEAPEQYPGDEAMQLHANTARTSQQIIDSLLRERDTKAREKTAGIAEQRWNAERPGVEATSLTKGLEAAAMTVPQDQASWDAWLNTLPVPVRMKMPVMFSPEAAKQAERMGMTPGQRATADNAAKPVPGRDVPLPPDVEKQRLRMSEARGRAQAGAATADDAKIIAQGIMNGDQPPDLKGMYRYQVPVRAELERNGFNLTVAQRDWQAVQKHISTLNGAQQERLRQAVTFTYDSLDQIESLYKEWKQVAPVSGVRLFNKAALKAAKNLPGKAGEVATNLEAQINDLTAELGTVYKGGNSSTDESLRLAGENLKAEWNEQTFQRALGTIRNNLRIRKNSIVNSQPAGMSANSPYNPAPAGGAKADPLGIR